MGWGSGRGGLIVSEPKRKIRKGRNDFVVGVSGHSCLFCPYLCFLLNFLQQQEVVTLK